VAAFQVAALCYVPGYKKWRGIHDGLACL